MTIRDHRVVEQRGQWQVQLCFAGEAITSVRSAVGEEPGYMLRVRRFESLGFAFNDFLIHVHDLPSGFGIDGVLGLSFLKRCNYEIRCTEGRILVTPV